jgi:hypothetical protein
MARGEDENDSRRERFDDDDDNSINA